MATSTVIPVEDLQDLDGAVHEALEGHYTDSQVFLTRLAERRHVPAELLNQVAGVFVLRCEVAGRNPNYLEYTKALLELDRRLEARRAN